MINNNLAADMFLELADLLDLAGELPFKSNSYRKVAQSLRKLSEPFDKIVGMNQWHKIPGAGKAIKEKLQALADTGQFSALEKWRQHEMAAYYPWLIDLNLKPRPLGMLVRKLKAKDFNDLFDKLTGYDIKKLTGQSRDTAMNIIAGKKTHAGRDHE